MPRQLIRAIETNALNALNTSKIKDALNRRAEKLGIDTENVSDADYWRIDQDQQIDLLRLNLPNESTDIFLREKWIQEKRNDDRQ